jgi:hypothetical protein
MPCQQPLLLSNLINTAAGYGCDESIQQQIHGWFDVSGIKIFLEESFLLLWIVSSSSSIPTSSIAPCSI